MTTDIEKIKTPATLLDENLLRSNIRRMTSKSDDFGVAFRPHAKTHKSVKIWNELSSAGAMGLTVATCEEAKYFMLSSCSDVLVAYPQGNIEIVSELIYLAQKTHTKITFIFDSVFSLEVLSKAASITGVTVNCFLKVDVGLHRCGVDPCNPNSIKTAQLAFDDRTINLCGLLSHAGHAYEAKSYEKVSQIAEKELTTLEEFKECLYKSGIDVRQTSIGSTPTLLTETNLSSVTEIRPGNFVFLDLTQVSLGVAKTSDIALSVLTSVISVNSSYFIIDAGTKILSADKGAHGSESVKSFGLAVNIINPRETIEVEKLSEEHGFLPNRGEKLKVGSKLRIFPNHSCVVANLSHEYKIIAGDMLIDSWSIGGRRR